MQLDPPQPPPPMALQTSAPLSAESFFVFSSCHRRTSERRDRRRQRRHVPRGRDGGRHRSAGLQAKGSQSVSWTADPRLDHTKSQCSNNSHSHLQSSPKNEHMSHMFRNIFSLWCCSFAPSPWNKDLRLNHPVSPAATQPNYISHHSLASGFCVNADNRLKPPTAVVLT